MFSLALIAVTHQSAPFAVLERVALDGDAADRLAAALLVSRTADEAIVLSTCNRTELYLAGDEPDAEAAIALLSATADVPVPAVRASVTVATGEDASLHLFRVAAGLESRIIGEGQILSQVRAAAARAVRAGTSGPHLSSLFRWAAATGRRARRDTGAAPDPSLARMALDAVGQLPDGATALVLGAGAMAAALTTELARRRVSYRVCARRPEQAARLVRRREDACGLDTLDDELARADVVVCATAARFPILMAPAVRATMAARRDRSLTIVDLSMPRNVAPEVAALPGVRLVDLQQLTTDSGVEDARRSNHVVTAEHHRYRDWLAGQRTGHLIAALHCRVHALCAAEASAVLGPAASDADVAALAHRVAGRMLHGPTVMLKELAAAGDERRLRRFIEMFGLSQVDGSPVVPGESVPGVASMRLAS